MKRFGWIALMVCLALCVSMAAFAEGAIEDVAAKGVDNAVSEETDILIFEDGKAAVQPKDEEDQSDAVVVSKSYDDELYIYDRTGNEVTMLKGEKLLVVVDDYSVSSWSSSKSSVASVSRINKHEAKIKAKKRGTATITGKTTKGKKIKITVEVEDPYTPKKVYIEHPDLNDKKLKTWVGEELDLDAIVEPDTAETTLKWKSSKTSVASVDKYGHVKAKKAGETKITVTTKNDKSYSITLVVSSNKAKGLCDKPTKSDVKDLNDELDFWLKSLSMSNSGKLTCEIYLLNGEYKYIKYLRDFDFEIYGDDQLIASKTFSKIKVTCSKNDYDLFKITFPSSYVDDSTPLRDYRHFELVVGEGYITK